MGLILSGLRLNPRFSALARIGIFSFYHSDLKARRLFLFSACFYPVFKMNAPPVPGEFVEVCMGPI